MKRMAPLAGGVYLNVRNSLRRRLPLSGWTDARFDKLIEVNPGEVQSYQDVRNWRDTRIAHYRPENGVEGPRFVLANVGKVIDGDWDLAGTPFAQNNIYRLLRERFVDGVPWDETEVWQRFAADIALGERRWHWSASVEELWAAARETEALYESIRKNGYRPAGSNGRGGGIDEITVSIGRDGELLYCNVGGHHRLSIAKILEIERVPVRVLLRHRRWQDVRDEVRASGHAAGASGCAAKLLEHPDLQDLR